jgi:hypothetical protein
MLGRESDFLADIAGRSKGPSGCFEGRRGAAILVEVQDLWTQPWGYRAKAIIQFLSSLDYRWFALAADGALHAVSTELDRYDANLVALPYERAGEFRKLVEGKRRTVGEGIRCRWPLRRRDKKVLESMVRVRQRKEPC